MFSLRIVSTSHYQAEPLPDLDVLYSSFRSTDVRRVPILRIFGATPAGQKTCMHVHGVFPYLFVPYDGTQPADSYLRRFAASLDKAINVANNSNANMQHVFKITLVSGIPMYGYHGEEQQFLKIYLYNPNSVRKAADLLLGGAVMNKSFQPHEAHIPFPLQLFIDYNLYGMNLINVAAVKFRRLHKGDGDAERSKPSTATGDRHSPDSSGQEEYGEGDGGTPSIAGTPSSSGGTNTPSITHWDLDNIPREMLLPASVERQSLCELEVDVVAADILNRREVADNMGSNPGLAALWEDERQRRRDAGQASQITPQDSQEHHNVEASESERQLMERLAEIIQQQRVLSRSESEESVVSMEDSTLTPEDVACIPASQLENHSQTVPDSEGSMPSSQDTVVGSGEKEEQERADSPIISLESIQRVVSFSQSFSRPSSQPTATPPDGEAADQSLVEVLAALAEESSPSASQRCAAHLSALEDQDSIVGQGVSLPPDSTALQEDEEETLHMSQTLPQESENGSEHFDLAGLDATWNGSSGDERDDDCAMESDDREDDDDDIPQLDGASDEKPAPSKSSKKRLGVRGPVLAAGSDGAGNEGSALQGELSNLPSSPQVQSPTAQGGGAPSRGDQGVPSAHAQQQAGMEASSSQRQGGYYSQHPQWGEAGGSANMGGMPQYPVHSPAAGGWGQSPPPQGSYPAMYRPHGSNYGYYPYPQRYPYTPSFRQSGPQSSPRQANFSPPPRSPMSPPSYPGGGAFPRPAPGSSPQQYGSFAPPPPPPQTQGAGMTAIRRHSEGSVTHQGAPFAGPAGWQYPAPGLNSGSALGMPAGSAHTMSAEPWSSNSFLGSPGPAQQQSGGQSPMGSGQFNSYPNPMALSQQNSNPSLTAPGVSQAGSGQACAEPSNGSKSQDPQRPPPSTLQALLEAPESGRASQSTHPAPSGSGGMPHRRAMSMDCSPSDLHASPSGRSDTSERSGQEFKLPEKRSGSFSAPGGGGSMIGGGQSSALSNLYNFVSNVDPMARAPTPTSRNSTPTPTMTPSSTPTSGPSPSVGSKEEEGASFVDVAVGPGKRQPQQPSPHPPVRSASVDEATGAKTGLVPPASASPLPFGSRSSSKDKVVGDQMVNRSKQETSGSSSDVPASSSSSSTASSVRNERLGKQSRMKKLGLTLQKTRRVSEDSAASPPITPTPGTTYTFTFHLPTPVYKRFKMRGVVPLRETEDIKVVRMHPMDARRYSLLKIGRELVRLHRLSPRELRNVRVAASAEDGSSVPDEHNSLIDPHTGELLSSLPGVPGVDESKATVQSSQGSSKTRQGASRRLMGPKCRRAQATADGSCQTSERAVGMCVAIKVESGLEKRVTSGTDAAAAVEGGQEVRAGSGSVTCPPQHSGHPPGDTPAGPNELPVNSAQSAMSAAGSDGSNSSQSWQTMDRDRRPSVKVEYPAQMPVNSGQWPGGQPPADPWGQGTSPNSAVGQWGGQWQGGSNNYRPAWNPNVSGSQPYNYPHMMEGGGAKQQPAPGQFPYNAWSGSSSAPSAAFSSSPSPASASASQPMPVVSSSPSASQGSMGSPTYPHPYPPNYAGYSSGQYNQQAAFSPTGPQNNSGNKFTGYPNVGPGRFPYPGLSPQHSYPPGQSLGHSAFQSNHSSQTYSATPGGGKDGYPSGHQGGFVPPQQQGGRQGQCQQNHQGQYMAAPSNPTSFQHNGGFSPHGQFSPSPNNPSQFPAGTPHPAPFTSVVGQPGQFSSSDHQPGQFPSQQGQFSGQPGHFQPLSGQPSQFPSPSGPPGRFPSPSCQPDQFSPPSAQPGQFSPSSHLGQFSPHLGQQSQMSPQTAYQGHFSPSASQQNQFFPLGSQQNCYPPYSGPDQFSQGMQANPVGGAAHASGASSQSSGNGHFLDTANQGNPFLHQGACQASTSTASDLTLPLENSGKHMQPDRPGSTDESQHLASETAESCTGTKHNSNKSRDRKNNSRKPSKAKGVSVSKKSDSAGPENSNDELSCGDQKASDGKMRRKSSDSSVGKKEKQTDGRKSPASQASRHSSVQLWSNGDSDSDDDDSDSDEESSDDYDPASRLHWKGRKRKCSRQQNQTQIKRTKRSSVNYNACAFSQYLAHDCEKKSGRKGRSSKNHKNKKSSQQPLIEGIHYIVVGKFKGHKVMLVKVKKVEVKLNERVKVTDWHGKVEQGQVKVRSRLLGPRCRRLGRGTSASDPAFVQSSDKKGSLDDDSDASTIVEGDLEARLCSDDKVKTELGTEHGQRKLDVNESNKDEPRQAQGRDDDSQVSSGVPVSDNFRRKEERGVHDVAEDNNPLTASHGKVPSKENAGSVDDQASDQKGKEVDCKSQQSKGESAREEAMQGNPRNCVTSESSHTTGSKGSRTGCAPQDKQAVEQDGKPNKTDAKNSSPAPRIPNPASGSGETGQGGETVLPVAMEVEADSKVAALEPTSRTQSPISKPGKRPNGSPSFVSEHSQDADCSSLPHSNPDSASSSPVSPCIPLTTTSCPDKDSQLHCQLNSDTKLLEREKNKRESKHASGPFCFQTVCEKAKGVRPNQRRLEPSSDSSDSHACFSEMRAHGDNAQHSPQSGSFTWKENLTSATNTKAADMDRDRLKKQKQLTPNQRLGVAFLSKRSRRRRNKVKVSGSKGESGSHTNKLMDSLSLLHMATLASLGGEHSSGAHNDHPSSPCGHVKDQADEKENHNTDSVECTKEKKFEWKTFDREDCAWKSRVHPSLEASCEMFKVGCNSDKSIGFGEVEKKAVYSEERKVISGTTEEMCDEPAIFATGVCFDKQMCLGTNDKLCEDSLERTDDGTVKVPKRQTNKQLRGYRKKKLKRKPACPRGGGKANKLLDSLDALHMATLASLGGGLPKTDHCDTSLPRYSDCVSDHAESFEESLIKMSYTSPVHSDLGDLSPPVPLSPEEFSNQDKVHERRLRSVPWQLKLEEPRGTRAVRMAQLRAKNAAELASRVHPPPSLPGNQPVCMVNSEGEGLVAGDTSHSKQPAIAKFDSCGTPTPGYVGGSAPTSAALAMSGHSASLPRSPSSVHPTIPDPEKLPTPAIPWHHPLHVITDGPDGGVWKDRVIHDALREKHQNGGGGGPGDKASPYSESQHRGERTRSVSSFSPRDPLFSGVSPRDMHRASERMLPASSTPLKEIYNHADERTIFSSGLHRGVHRVGERMPPNALTPLGGRTPPFSGVSHRDVFSVSSKTPPYSFASERDVHTVNSKTPPRGNFSQKDVHSVDDRMAPFSGASQTGINAKTPPYSSASYADLPRFGHKTPPASDTRRNSWLCDKLNTEAGGQPHRPGTSGDQMINSQPQRSPRELGLSRTEMIISQMFNLDSSSTSGKSPPNSAASKSPASSSKHKLAESMLGGERSGLKQWASRDRDCLKEAPQYNYRQMSGGAKLYTSCSPGRSQAKSLATPVPDQLHSSQKPADSVSSDRYADTSSKSPSAYSYASQKFPAYSEKYCSSAKSFSTSADNYQSESARSPLNYAAKNTHSHSSTAHSDKYCYFSAKSPSAYRDKSKSPSAYGQDMSKSPSVASAYYNNTTKSPGAYLSGNYLRSPGYSYEKYSSPHVKSPSVQPVDSYGESGKSPYSYTPEKYNCSPGRSAYSHTPEKLMPAASARTPCTGEKSLSSSKSPVVPLPGPHSSKSPSRMSPRQSGGKDWDNARHGRADAWLQPNRKRSIGEYLDEVIESTFAELTPGAPKCLHPGVSDCDSVTRGQGQDADSVKSTYRDVVSSQAADPLGYAPVTVTGDTNVALDLSACSRKQEAAGTTGLSSARCQHLVPTLAATAASYTSSMPTACAAATAPIRPTWTSIKTDNFENITDDEDEDVIPSSQEYSASAYRFPGFSRLSSISSTWSPYSFQSQPCMSAASRPSSDRVKDLDSRTSLPGALISGQGYPSSVYQYDKGLYSQATGIGAASRLSSQGAFSSVAASPEKRDGASQHTFTSAGQVPYQTPSLVTSFGTPWRDTQVQGSAASTSVMSQFEPITDSEEEDDGKVAEDPQRTRGFTCTTYPPAAYSSAMYFPTYSSSKMASAYTSLSSNSAMPPHSKYPFLMEASGRWPSSSSAAPSQDYVYTTSAAGSSIYDASVTGTLSSVPGFYAQRNLPLAPSLASARHVGDCMDSDREVQTGSLLHEGGGGDEQGGGDPEDGGGRKTKKASGGPPSNPSSSSSSSSSPGEDGQRRGEQQGSDDSHRSEGRGDEEEQAADPEAKRSKYVLCPKAPPPSRSAVEASAASVGLAVEPVTRAFCSHPTDLPDRPRELGGRVLRLATNRVTELEEMPPPGAAKGLRSWQSLRASESRLLSSQPDPATVSFAQRLEQEPQLRFALAGDGPCIITPVKAPPCRKVVAGWLEDKLESLKPAGEKGAPVEGAQPMDGADADVEMTLPLDIDAPEEEREGASARESSDDEDSMFTRLKDRRREAGNEASRKTCVGDDNGDDGADGGSTPKRPCLDSDSVLHSTPVRRSSSELFDPGCTPVAAGKRAEGSASRSEQTGPEFITPKRPPLRRLSTNTESALRRAILTTETRRQSFEGEVSQIDGPTPRNTHGFKVTQQKLQDAKALHKHQFLTVLSMEVHADTRGDMLPDPEMDAVRIIFYAVFDDVPPDKGRRNVTGALVVDKESCAVVSARKSPQPSTSGGSATLPPDGKGKQTLFEKCAILEELDVTYVESEGDLLKEFTDLISRLDPDILLGFEVQQLSWGFLLQRAAHLSFNLCSQIARIQGSKQGNRFSAERDEWGADYTSEIHIEGRIILNLWRVLRHEVTLNIYTYENCAFHILHRRVPAYTLRSLTAWYNHRTRLHCWRVVQHYTQRVTGQLAMLDQLDIIGKTSEFARVFGIEFYDVLSRGSQYRVESMMLRLAKPLNFIPVSPSVQQRARQKAPECIPLTLEPQSRFYTDPVVVLDFQSLYPSIMIAYNYCFSTCLGRVENLAQAHNGPIEFGCTSLSVPPDTLRKLRKKVTISPNGCVFVTSKVRRGVLPMMVEEILKTRLMVKKSMKDYKDDKVLHRMLDARQLGLKLIANVTYGYTGATFSGRMPCIEVADSIVRKARESLERAIQLVKETARWQAQVVYGDTDSLFIVLPGRSKDEAFVIGQEIADAVTDMFPKPMKLRFEKVYLPCVLQTKKRYVGFMYETRDQKEPAFDAKGIETVRRDNCGVASKVLERCIKILFTMRDVSQVRSYLQRQFTKMLWGRVGLQDYIFAKEFRGMMGYKAGACVPALEIARKRLQEDRRAEPRVGERIPYVIVHGSPGLPLIQLVRQPRELLHDASLRINVTYYITKQVLPPLDRLMGLVGVSVFQWYNDMPKVVRLAPHVAPTQDTKQGTISQYFVTSDCLVCERQTKQAVCASCLKDPQLVAATLASRSTAWEAVQDKLAKVCISCMGVQDHSQPCVSLDCPVLFRRHLATQDLARADQCREALQKAIPL